MRKAAQIAGAAAVAAMLLSGCGSSGDKGDKGSDSAPSKAPESGASTPGGGDKATGGKAFEGPWKAGPADSPLVLVVSQGTVAFAEGHKTACMGKVQEMGGTAMAVLTCSKGDDSRTMGTLKPGSDGKTMTVDWKNGPTEKYTKVTDGSVKVPDMPKLPDMPAS